MRFSLLLLTCALNMGDVSQEMRCCCCWSAEGVKTVSTPTEQAVLCRANNPLGSGFLSYKARVLSDQVIRNMCLDLYKWIFITIFVFTSFNVMDYFTCSIIYRTYPQNQTQPKCPSVEDNMVHVYSH